MKYPDVYLVGAPKCGTTSLHYYLGQHPDIFAPAFKEPHFHTVALTGWPKWGVRSEAEYLDLYRHALPDQRWIDASAWNLYVPGAADLIYSTSPDARIIISLRHPVKRAYSHYLHMVQRGWEKYYTFQDAIDHEEERIEAGEFWDVHYLTAGYYARQVQQYFDVFPQEQIKVLIFEEWVQYPEQYVQEILRFLQVDEALKIQEKAAKNVTQLSYDQMLRMHLQKVSKLKNIASAVLPDGLKRQAMGWLQGKSVAQIPQLSDELLRELSRRYVDDVQVLEGILGRSLAVWQIEQHQKKQYAGAIANTVPSH